MQTNAMDETFQEITVLGKPALFSGGRIDRQTVPMGLYAYDVRQDDEQQGIPCQIAKHILVNHWGTILLAEPLKLPADGCLTKLDDPLVQGRDNSYYLTHLATGESNKHGAIFVDCRNGALLEDENTILYGHNMNDGSMFHGLLSWSNADYAAAHPALYLLTPHKSYELKVFNACVVTADSPEYQLDFTTTSKAAWLDQCARHSFFTADFVPDGDAPVVTFSTCSSKNHWFVVQASATEIEPDGS